MGLRIDPSVDVVRVDGTRVQVNEEMVYFALNKPRGVHSTMHDDLGRPHVGELIEAKFNQSRGCSMWGVSMQQLRGFCC